MAKFVSASSGRYTASAPGVLDPEHDGPDVGAAEVDAWCSVYTALRPARRRRVLLGSLAAALDEGDAP